MATSLRNEIHHIALDCEVSRITNLCGCLPPALPPQKNRTNIPLQLGKVIHKTRQIPTGESSRLVRISCFEPDKNYAGYRFAVEYRTMSKQISDIFIYPFSGSRYFYSCHSCKRK
jgi:hypothetical protein